MKEKGGKKESKVWLDYRHYLRSVWELAGERGCVAGIMKDEPHGDLKELRE